MKLIEVKKLAAVDMVWLGARIITLEYFLGIVLPLGLGLLSLDRGQKLIGFWLVTIAANYVPLFLYALYLQRTHTVEQEGGIELARAKTYGVQQVVILIPFFVIILSIIQELRRNRL